MTPFLALASVLIPMTKPDFSFMGQGFFHRYSKDDLHEYTPQGQEDLAKWKDMMTLNVYAKVKDGEALAKAANSVLDAYQKNGGRVVRTDSVPRSGSSEAEHLIVVLFPKPEFIEVSFARFKMSEGKGVSLVYGHRVYGKKAGDEAAEWLQKNGPATEKALMAWKTVPVPPKKKD
ncbi:MAG: hypothetical protein JST30_02025 [Armatimonadetes bacterium]|nr:hypothetical protein [Armatimonadota bacterium]